MKVRIDIYSYCETNTDLDPEINFRYYIAERMIRQQSNTIYRPFKNYSSFSIPTSDKATYYTMMKLAIFGLFCLQAVLAAPPSKALVEESAAFPWSTPSEDPIELDWEVRFDLQH